jgi:hypothetical protein
MILSTGNCRVIFSSKLYDTVSSSTNADIRDGTVAVLPVYGVHTSIIAEISVSQTKMRKNEWAKPISFNPTTFPVEIV